MNRLIAGLTVRIITVLSFFLLALPSVCSDKATQENGYEFLPPMRLWGNTDIVDEPQGARYSLGTTLWHLGHKPDIIRRFHVYLKERGIKPEDVLPKEKLTPPETLRRILVQPELIPSDELGGWHSDGIQITSHSADAGPSVSLTIEVDRSGLYRLWVRYFGWADATALTSLKIYKVGKEEDGPLVDDEIHDSPEKEEGYTWKDIMVELKPGKYTIRLSHKTRWWQAPKHIGWRKRLIDCIYLTDEIWAEAPSEETLDAVCESGKPNGILLTQAPQLKKKDFPLWTWWQVRPIHWEMAKDNKKLFDLSYYFWQRGTDVLARAPYSELPDYRDQRRQVIFDDVWNIVANPARIRRQRLELQKDVDLSPNEHQHYWINASRFNDHNRKTLGDWWPVGGKVVSGTYYNFAGTAKYEQNVGRGHTYHFWVQFRNAGYFEPWQIYAWPEGDKEKQTIHWKRDKRGYTMDIEPQKAWVKVGSFSIPEDHPENKVCWEIRDLPWGGLRGVSYRWIWAFFITSDPDWVPKGTVMPPDSMQQYMKRVVNLDGSKEDGYLIELRNPYSPISQIWWPSKNDINPAWNVVMARDTVQSIQIGLRSASENPISLGVKCDPLKGKAGTFPGKVTWRVIAFVPYGDTRATWSPFCLLRRPYINIPPLGVAGIWLSINNKDVPPGEYTSKINIQAVGYPSNKEYPSRTVTLNVRVSRVEAEPKKPVLVHGYNMPPEGESYLNDYIAHGIRVWCSLSESDIISKDEMERRGMQLQQIRARKRDNNYKPLLDKLKKLGLDYKDYYLIIWDEPSGKTEQELERFLNAAKAIREENPRAQIAFNPGEPATLATFKILDPYCDVWMPYYRHFVYHPNEVAAKTAIITAKPWMDYTTPCYYDKEPRLPAETYDRIRAIPSKPGKCIGTWFFALYYPWRDPWDTAYEHIKDVSVFVLPSRHGPVPTIAYEAVCEGIQHANLAQMVKERVKKDDKETQNLVASGSVEQLIQWLETH